MLGFIETRILCQGVRFPFPAPLMQGQGGLGWDRFGKDVQRGVQQNSEVVGGGKNLVVRVSRGSTGYFLLEAGGGGGGWT